MSLPLLPNIAPFRSTNFVVPFTYRDNDTYLTILHSLRENLDATIDYVNGIAADDTAAVNAALTELTTNINALVATQNAAIETAITNADTANTNANNSNTTLTNQVNALTATVNAQIATLNGLIADLPGHGTPLPAWVSTVHPFDRTNGVYNFGSGTLPRFRTAKAGLIAGTTPLHIAVIGDSTAARASDSDPANRVSWPSVMGRQLAAAIGSTVTGTGIIPLWNTVDEAVVEPRVTRVVGAGGGAIQDTAGLGYYGQSVVSVFSPADGSTYLQFAPGIYCDEFIVYTLSTGNRSLFDITDGVTTHSFEMAAFPGEVWTPAAGVTAIQPEPGYVRSNDVPTNGGQMVARLTVPRQNNWELRIKSPQPGSVSVAAVEASDNESGGVRVSNLAQAGVSLSALVPNSNDVNGFVGLPLAVDAAKAKLYIVSIGINDFQSHSSAATYKTQLETLVDRIRTNAATGTYGFGQGVAADCLLMITPQPNYAMIPADGVEVPPLSDFWTALYQVADEKNLGVVDNAFRWVDYASSSDLFRDNIHPSFVGAADIGNHVAHLLAVV
jgi:lysophospholipase L1-like esterase